MAEKKIFLLTTDRYWPWDGSYVDREDRIWGPLDTELSLPFLVYRTRSNSMDGVGQKKAVSIDATTRSTQVWTYLLSGVLRSLVNAVVHRNTLFLLFNWRSRVLPSFVWYWAYAHLRNHFALHDVDAVMFHGEFNAWGRAVAWSCRDAGVVAVAWQHGVGGPVPVSRPQRRDERLPLPHHLFVWSEFALSQSDKSLARHVGSSIGGTLRFGNRYTTCDAARRQKILLCPSTHDFNAFVTLAMHLDAFPQELELVFRVHPLRSIQNEAVPGWLIDVESIDESFASVGAVVVGISSIAVDALRRGIPVIVPLFLKGVEGTPFAVAREGVFPCASQAEFFDACRAIVLLGGVGDRSGFHDSARYFAQDVQREHVLATLRSLVDDGA